MSNQVVKMCKVHGDLYENEVYKTKRLKKNKINYTIQIRCKRCYSAKCSKRYYDNKSGIKIEKPYECKVHGKIDKSLIMNKASRRCSLCNKAAQEKYRKNHPHAFSFYNKIYVQKNRIKYNQRRLDWTNKQTMGLKNSYVKQLLRQSFKMNATELMQIENINDLIQIKKSLVTIRRTIKERINGSENSRYETPATPQNS